MPYKNIEDRRAAHRRWALKNRRKRIAINMSLKAFPDQQVCEVTGCLELGERHHDDYDKPLEIRWLCKKHHERHHAKYWKNYKKEKCSNTKCSRGAVVMGLCHPCYKMGRRKMGMGNSS